MGTLTGVNAGGSNFNSPGKYEPVRALSVVHINRDGKNGLKPTAADCNSQWDEEILT